MPATTHELIGRDGELAAITRRAGLRIRYVRTTSLPEDETCFHLFEASSADVVEQAISRAELGRARVVEAVEHLGPAHALED